MEAPPHGSAMESAATCGLLPSPKERFERLTDAYRRLLTGSLPSQSAAEVARVIFSGVCGPVEDREDREWTPSELTCISLTLVDKLASNLLSGGLSPAVSSYCASVLAGLFQDLDVMSQLITKFRAEDQITSHLAAKTVSACVFYQLHQSGTVSPVWQQKCVQAFNSSSPAGPELDSCLWSLTEVVKRLLKGAHREILRKLLAALDSSLSALCSRFLPEQRPELTQCLDRTSSRRWGTTLCLLLDLLEVLTASSYIYGSGVCLRSQRMTHIHSSALLTTVSCSSLGFVKKRALLLLKRALLHKAGEDWAAGEALLAGLKHKHFNADMSLLAHSVLTAVAADWLQSVQVESASFFGGTRLIREEEGQKTDCVMLRAISLLLLKSVELHIQTAGVDGATEVYGYLQSLWFFLRRCSVQLTEVTHHCCWVSLLFGEQDDDMIEAAKALFSIFLHHRRRYSLDDVAVLEAACDSGCNPHCHFLLLLRSVSFDHSILLDFLISTETCFLEYFVRYLKYLTADWQGFAASCGRIGSPDGHPSPQRSTCEPDEVCSRIQSTGVTSPVAAGFHLVEYDSSDESDPDNMEVSLDEPAPSACEKNRFIASDSTLERGLSLLQSEHTSRPNSSETLTRAVCTQSVLCLSELREVVTRLHTKKLFPYNPSSLLKLLAQVVDSYQQSRGNQ